MALLMSEGVVLAKFVGRKEGQTLPELANEIKQLAPAHKHELAVLAARELGLSATQVDFNLE